VVSCRLEGGEKNYLSTFGDPLLTAGATSIYTRARLLIEVHRHDSTGFLKLMAGALAAAMLTLISFFLHVDQSSALSPRFSLVAGSLFASVIGMRSASSELGAVTYLTLIDRLHLAVFVYIIVATVTGVVTLVHFQRHKNADVIRRMGLWTAGASTLALLLVISVTVMWHS
jgi:hypothetical protein